MVCVMKLKIFGLILLVLQTVITCSYSNKVFFFQIKSVKKKEFRSFLFTFVCGYQQDWSQIMGVQGFLNPLISMIYRVLLPSNVPTFLYKLEENMVLYQDNTNLPTGLLCVFITCYKRSYWNCREKLPVDKFWEWKC